MQTILGCQLSPPVSVPFCKFVFFIQKILELYPFVKSGEYVVSYIFLCAFFMSLGSINYLKKYFPFLCELRK